MQRAWGIRERLHEILDRKSQLQYHACWKFEMCTNCWEKRETDDSDVLGVLGSNAKLIPHVMNAG
jgi:hypothetical protein